jgi:hypothetical protein
MLQQKFSHNWKKIAVTSLILSSFIGCATPEPIVVTKTNYVVKKIQLQAQPKPLNLHRVKFYAVTPENMEEFLQKFEEESGGVPVFFALSIPDYENMSLNVAELRRYINQQKALVIYYEDSITQMIEQTPENTEETVTPEPGRLDKLWNFGKNP